MKQLVIIVKNVERQKLLQALAKTARNCNVQGVRDDVGRKKATEMMSAIRGSSGSADLKESAEETWKAYEATFAAEAQQDEDQVQVEGRLRRRRRHLDVVVDVVVDANHCVKRVCQTVVDNGGKATRG